MSKIKKNIYQTIKIILNGKRSLINFNFSRKYFLKFKQLEKNDDQEWKTYRNNKMKFSMEKKTLGEIEDI